MRRQWTPVSKDPLAEAEAIASGIAGGPVGIRFVRVPRTKTGLTLNANIMGAHLAQLMMKSRRPGCDTVSWRYRSVGAPQEALDGLHELECKGIITTATRGRLWLDNCMGNPAHRNMFVNWDGDHQTRVSQDWEEYWYRGVAAKIIRPHP